MNSIDHRQFSLFEKMRNWDDGYVNQGTAQKVPVIARTALQNPTLIADPGKPQSGNGFKVDPLIRALQRKAERDARLGIDLAKLSRKLDELADKV